MANKMLVQAGQRAIDWQIDDARDAHAADGSNLIYPGSSTSPIHTGVHTVHDTAMLLLVFFPGTIIKHTGLYEQPNFWTGPTGSFTRRTSCCRLLFFCCCGSCGYQTCTTLLYEEHQYTTSWVSPGFADVN